MNDIERIQKLAGIVNEKDAGSVEKLAVGHVDNERDMVRRDIYQIGKYAIELFKMLDELPDSDFPHWWQSKIVKAEEFLSSAKGYLEAELYAPEEESPLDDVQDDDINPSGV